MARALGTPWITTTVWKQQFPLSQTRLTQEEQPDCKSSILCTQLLQAVLNCTGDKCCQPALGIHRETALHRSTGRMTLMHLQLGTRQQCANKFQSPRESGVGINCLGSILNLSSPKGGSGQGMLVPEENGKENKKAYQPTSTLKAHFP